MLDAATEAALLENLRQVCAGCTTLLITHRLAAARLADRIMVMDAGRLVEEGTHAELLGRRGAYRQLWLAQRQDQPAQPSPAADALPGASAEPATRPFVRRQAARRRRA
jgi:ATP-binding cassette, subfamily B, bacterial